jgi:hypothetical protein
MHRWIIHIRFQCLEGLLMNKQVEQLQSSLLVSNYLESGTC